MSAITPEGSATTVRRHRPGQMPAFARDDTLKDLQERAATAASSARKSHFGPAPSARSRAAVVAQIVSFADQDDDEDDDAMATSVFNRKKRSAPSAPSFASSASVAAVVLEGDRAEQFELAQEEADLAARLAAAERTHHQRTSVSSTSRDSTAVALAALARRRGLDAGVPAVTTSSSSTNAVVASAGSAVDDSTIAAAAAAAAGDADAVALELQARRERARLAAAAAAARQQLEATSGEGAEVGVDEAAEGNAEDDSSVEYEYVTDSDDEGDEAGGGGAHALPPPPMFISKRERETLKETATANEAEEAAVAEAEEAKREEERVRESRRLVEEVLAREREEAQAAASMDIDAESAGESTDSEGADQDEEFEKWKLRELARIKRAHEETLQATKEHAEVEWRRKLTDEQIKRLDAARLKRPVKKKLKFLQKYYHKGAFFQGDDVLAKHDFSQPTGEDANVNKELLPAVLQVKKFGRMGRTKYTHLADQDTTRADAGWAAPEGLGALHRNAPADLREAEVKRRKAFAARPAY